MVTGIQQRERRKHRSMTNLERWLLKREYEKHGLDTRLIDHACTFSENMKIPELVHAKTWEDCEEYPDPIGAKIETELEEDLCAIIRKERRNTKKAKYEIGKRILKDEEYLNRRYGDNYFHNLAQMIDEKGYGADQLRKCVKFAKHPEAERWLGDSTISWETIRAERLRQKQLDPIESDHVICPEGYAQVLLSIEKQLSDVHGKCAQNVERILSCGRWYCTKLQEKVAKERKRLEKYEKSILRFMPASARSQPSTQESLLNAQEMQGCE